MKNIVPLFVLALLFSGACSQNEDMPENSGNVIGFYATAPKGSRAASTTTSTLQSFVVWAYTDSELLMNGVTVSRDGGSWKYSPPVYWPGTDVNFYAVSPDLRQSGDTQPDEDNVIRNMTCGNTDLLYAVSLNQYERPTPVDLTFRHAMSKVGINLSSTSNKYDIKVYHVLLKNIYLQGDFALPNKNTIETTAIGTWSNLTKMADVMLFYNHGESISLTTTPTDVTEGNLEMSFFVPQELDPFVFSKTGAFSGAYVEIDCEVIDKATGNKIWPSEHTPDYLLVQNPPCGRMLFPLSTGEIKAWQQGYSYVYNIIINNAYIVDTIEFQPGVIDFTEVNPY